MIEFDSGMIVSSIVNWGCGFGKRSCFNEINNEKILLGANMICRVLPNWEIAPKSSFNLDAAVAQPDLSGI